MEALLVGSCGNELERDIQLAGITTAPVLITGERGVGKDVVARLVHDRSARRAAPFVTVACNGLTESQLQHRLFGARPDAHQRSESPGIGALREAQGGTLQFDAVADMGLRVQQQLLRWLRARELQTTMSTPLLDVRIVATTSRPLFERVLAGEFLEALYYHLNIMHLVIPPLRERRDDIPAVIVELLEDLSRRRHVPRPRLAPQAVASLQAYEWPENVRELRRFLESLLASAPLDTIDLANLPSITVK